MLVGLTTQIPGVVYYFLPTIVLFALVYLAYRLAMHHGQQKGYFPMKERGDSGDDRELETDDGQKRSDSRDAQTAQSQSYISGKAKALMASLRTFDLTQAIESALDIHLWGKVLLIPLMVYWQFIGEAMVRVYAGQYRWEALLNTWVARTANSYIPHFLGSLFSSSTNFIDFATKFF